MSALTDEQVLFIKNHGENTLVSNSVARIIDVISEGEIEGFATGDSGEDVLINTLPLSSFDGLSATLKTGAVSQEHIPGFSAEEQYLVSTELLHGDPVIHNITNSNVDEVVITIKIPTLLLTSKSGKRNATEIEFSIKINSTLIDTKKIVGRTTSEYLKSYRLPLLSDYGSGPWAIELERVTVISPSTRLVNNIHWDSYTTLINEKIPYLDTALVGFTADAQQFGGRLPSRLYHVKGIKVRYPSNYNPETRVYAGIWDGTFTIGYTNNPAWVYYDLLYSDRYGCGFEKDAGDGDYYIDKWELYSIAQNCDIMVDDGDGGTEPRFTFNSVISKRSQAISILTSLASTFRGKPFWYTGLATVSQDRAKDPVKVVCNADVIGGTFQYTGSSLEERVTCINISWNDPEDFYKTTVEVIEDQEGITRYGYNIKDINAYGCTSRAQAIRYGRWYLYTELKQTTTVMYSASFDHFQLIPGDVIIINDDHYITKKLGGRIISATTTEIVIDRDIILETGKTYTIVTENPKGEVVRADILNSAEITNTLSISTVDAGDVPQNWAVFSINSDSFDERQFQIIDLTFKEKNIVGVKALLYDGDKFDVVDTGIYFDDKHYSDIEEGELLPPTNLEAEEYSYDDGQNNLFGVMLSWSHPEDARVNRYFIQSKEESGDWFGEGTAEHNSCTIKPIVAGNYYFRVRSISLSSFSAWTTTTLTTVYADPDALSPITDLKTISGDGGGSDEFEGKNCEIVWGYDFEDRFKEFVIEAYNGTTLKRTAATTEQSFIYTYEMNEEDNTPAIRSINFIVYVRDVYNKLSAGASLTATNPIPSMAGNIPTIDSLFNAVKINWNNIVPADNDLLKFMVYFDKSDPPTTLIAEVGVNTTSWLEGSLVAGNVYYCQIEPWDCFGAGERSSSGNQAPILLPSDSIDMELTSTIEMSDSDDNSEEILSKLYDRNKGSDGITYIISGTDEWIEYKFPVEYIMDNVTMWFADANAKIYVGYKRGVEGDWHYLKADTGHGLDSEGRMLDATSLSDAQANYLNANAGVFRAMFPQALVATHCKLFFIGSYTTTIYELIFTREVIAEQIVADNLSSISANIGTVTAGIIQSANYGTTGILLDLNNDSLYIGGTGSPKLRWNSITQTLEINAKVIIGNGSSGYDNIEGKPNNLNAINPIEGNKLTGIASNADVTGDNSQAIGWLTEAATNNNRIPVNSTDAKCTDANADQTSANTAANTNNIGTLPAINVQNWAHDADKTMFDGGTLYTRTVVGNAIVTNAINSGHVGTNTIISSSSNLGTAVVDTLSIDGNAVTVPVFTTTGSILYGSGMSTWVRAQYLYVNLSVAGTIQATTNISIFYPTGVAEWDLCLIKYGETKTNMVHGGASMDVSACVSNSWSVSAGIIKIEVWWRAPVSSVGLNRRALIIMGVKR